MKKPKKLKYPKKPKASASLTSMQNYLRKRSGIDKENKRRENDYNKGKALRTKISRM